MQPPVRVAVIGAGAFGRNHLRVFSELAVSSTVAVELAAFVETNERTRGEVSARYPVPAFASVDELLASGSPLDAATICVPTIAHAQAATQLLEAGVHVLIEKPITATLAEADALLALASSRDRLIAVGHLERFNPAVTACAARLTRPMFFEAHRLSVFTPRSLDVDVVLDLMIHDLDVVLSLCNSGIREVRAVGLPVLSSRVDIANARLEFNSGCIANFTASRVSTEQVRKLRLFQPRQYLSLDFARQELLSIEIDPAALGPSVSTPLAPTELEAPATELARPITEPAKPATEFERPATDRGARLPHPSPGLSIDKLDVPRVEPLRLELEDFVHAVRHRSQPRVTGAAGRAALAAALEIAHEISLNAHRAGLT